ncbi:COBRA-like protein 2 [Magnolia sinica]|uniref:COBRA-like protein 2 n=1 Tax=Magnolia sinica TaxID=86752 RepID=UPI00265A6744|nr:COBRA-like protein 2 [Magnolia sinica]
MACSWERLPIAVISSSVEYIRQVILFLTVHFSHCYDPLDPDGSITITFDIYQWRPDGYEAMVTVQNFYQYRHVEKPGWKLGWTWTQNEVIWTMTGALALRQGNCSAFNVQTAHSCKRDPVIVDLMPEALPENRTENCCRGGLVSAWGIDRRRSLSSFEMLIGNLGGPRSYMPENLTFLGPGPGYTCGPLADFPPTVFSSTDVRREMQVFRTWKSTCTYSNFLANKVPICCVSLSTFYNSDVTPCPTCSCGCRLADKNTLSCISNEFSTSLSTELDHLVRCTDHMCPVRVHWHIKNNYKEYWRVKLTVSNYNFGTNYTDWNVVVQHPGFGQSIEYYSFNGTTLGTIRLADEVALFWGLTFYNDVLLQAVEDQPGSVTTEILLHKDLNTFTLENGWAFPRRVYFNGENCEMPMPDNFPGLPNSSSNHGYGILPLILALFLSFKILLWL